MVAKPVILNSDQGCRGFGTVSLGYEDFGLPWFDLYERVLKNMDSE